MVRDFLGLILVVSLVKIPSLQAATLDEAATLNLINVFEQQNTVRLQKVHGVPLKMILEWDKVTFEWGLVQYLNDTAGGARIERAAVMNANLTTDALLLAMCHELGHLIRDRSRSTSFFGQVELLTDYFATSDCFIAFLRHHPSITATSERVSDDTLSLPLVRRCAEVYGTESDLCERALRASFSVATFIGFDRTDLRLPSWKHLALSAEDWLQCSLEVYAAGVFKDPLPACFDLKTSS